MKTHFLFGLVLLGAIIVLLMNSASVGGGSGGASFTGQDVLTLILALIILSWLAYSAIGKTIFLIFWRQMEIFRGISGNENAIEKLRKKIDGLQERAFNLKMDQGVKCAIEANILIWKDQIDIHQRIIRIYEKKRARLWQHLGELRILRYLRNEVRKEPDAGKRLQRLAELNRKIDKSINFNIKKEIDQLLGEIRTEFRREKIVALQQRLSDIEKQIA